MKKILAILLTVMMLASMATVASAAESTTTLTTTVPAATYTLNIPANQEIVFGAVSSEIGNITVTNSSGFAVGKNLNVTFVYDAFTSQAVSTTIPYTIKGWSNGGNNNGQKFASDDLPSGTTLVYLGTSSGSVSSQTKLNITSQVATTMYPVDRGFTVEINSADWGKALAGEYTATITFTCEVVVEE